MQTDNNGIPVKLTVTLDQKSILYIGAALACAFLLVAVVVFLIRKSN